MTTSPNPKDDKELLELAARAAGYGGMLDFSGTCPRWTVANQGRLFWNPLAEDGDALRLAVKLGIEIGSYHQYGRALAYFGVRRGVNEFWESNLDDHCAATRRAIVRAAAEIARQESSHDS